MATLLQFTVGNYRSFHQARTFSMVPSSVQDEPKECVVVEGRYKYLTAAAIYGANSSGKSNLVMALATMKTMVLKSVMLNDNDELFYDPFLLVKDTESEPTHFEIVYLDAEGIRIRYGFDYALKKICREWLFLSDKSGKEKPYFVRDEEGIGVEESLFVEGVGLEERTNDNRLFLSLVAQLGGSVSKSILKFFKEECNILSGLNSRAYQGLTEKQFLDKSEEVVEVMKFFQDLQLGFIDIETTQLDADKDRGALDVYSIHYIYGKNGEVTGKQRFRFLNCESQGTQKLFDLAGPLFNALRHGQLLVIDELDAKMHPLISQHIIRLFSGAETNPHHAQLLFTTHDTNLLSSRLLRRDQIWFTEKDKTESTDLYSLMHIVLPDGSKPRGDGNLERNYIKGRYGAIPYLRTIE